MLDHDPLCIMGGRSKFWLRARRLMKFMAPWFAVLAWRSASQGVVFPFLEA